MKLIIADDHQLVRDALSTLIQRDQKNSTVLQASSLDEAMSLAACNPDTDIALIDVYMPGMNAVANIAKMVKAFPKLPIVLMSGIMQQRDVEECFKHGARGFLPKNTSGDTLVSVLRLVQSGARYIPEMFIEIKNEPGGQDLKISSREQEVVGLLAKGLANKMIARQLGIEECTVKLHVRSLFVKLGVKNRTEAALAAIQEGLCPSISMRG